MSQSPESDQAGRDVKDLERQVAQQEALVLRMITQGTPTQADEDRLRQLQQKLTQMKERVHSKNNEALLRDPNPWRRLTSKGVGEHAIGAK